MFIHFEKKQPKTLQELEQYVRGVEAKGKLQFLKKIVWVNEKTVGTSDQKCRGKNSELSFRGDWRAIFAVCPF